MRNARVRNILWLGEVGFGVGLAWFGLVSCFCIWVYANHILLYESLINSYHIALECMVGLELVLLGLGIVFVLEYNHVLW